ncbi:MAG: hypothetical protein AAGK02_12160 [Pseudomonadota bacterium]
MTPEQIAAEVAEAERETAEYEAQRKARHEAYLATLIKDARYYARHKAKRICDTIMHRARGEDAAPQWLTDERKRQTLEVYEAAESQSQWTGIEHEVDHLVPLKGKNKDGDWVICGLHVPWNVRAIPWSLNRKRGDWFVIGDAERKPPSLARREHER